MIKNTVTPLILVLIAFVTLGGMMGFARVAPAETPKSYILVTYRYDNKKFQEEVNQKLAEGWHLEGGVAAGPNGYVQAMSK